MKKVLGLDLGTNSIGWALVEIDHKNGTVKILGLGSRIVPMDAREIKDFESTGKINSTASQRTEKRGARRLNERYLLRRDRLHLVLNLLDSLPEHYKLEIDFANSKGEKSGQFKKNKEPKLAYLPSQKGRKTEFIFMDSYHEMLNEINDSKVKDEKGMRIPYDWTLYYLRVKALSECISLEELAWVLLSYNQKRGYEKTEVLEKSVKDGELIEEFDLRVIKVSQKIDNEGEIFFEVHLNGNDKIIYHEYSEVQLTFENDLKEVRKKSQIDNQGNVDIKKTEFTIVDIYSLQINEVNYEINDGKHNYTLSFHNGWQEIKKTNKFTYKYENALNKPFDYIVETIYDSQGIKSGRKLREPDLSENSNDWTLVKKKTEKIALTFNADQGYLNEDRSAKNYISPSIYSVLKSDAKSGNRTKIIGGLFQVVDRKFYREELKQIINTQRRFHKGLDDHNLFEQCVKTLYPKNKSHQKSLLKNKEAIQNLLVEDIILYHRSLKTKKSEISNCKHEISYWKDVLSKTDKQIEEIDKETGEVKIIKEPVYNKAVSVSHPYFQEFRIWDKLHSLRLIQHEKVVDGKLLTNQDVTKEYFKSNTDYQELFEKLRNQKSLTQSQFLSYCKKEFKIDNPKIGSNFSWNFPIDEELKGNETRVSFATRFKRCGFTSYSDFITQEKELDLWRYLYSVNFIERKANNKKSIKSFFKRFLEGSNVSNEVKEKIILDFENYPKFESRYCAYSEKALKKMLPLIRFGEQKEPDNWADEQWYVKWNKSLLIREREILNKVNKIDFDAEKVDYDHVKITNADVENGEIPFPKGLFNTFKNFKLIEDFKNLNLTQVSYLIYGRHSELAQAKYWTSPEDIRQQLHQELKQHSLNNPVAEKIILEMMQVVADIWDYYGNGESNFFSKIHLEVGRELKKSAKEKDAETKRMSGNRAQNKRIRQVLEDFLSEAEYNANPRNLDHFERLKIVEEGAQHTKNTDKDFFKDKKYSKNDIDDILKKPYISKVDFEKYKLWIEQGYKSPYTDRIIKITDLFDGEKYNVDHVFPQASITNNSLSNKVVCEKEINILKSNQTGREFINNPKRRKIYCSAHNGEVEIINDDVYVRIIKTQFSGTKRLILLSREVPSGFTNSQMNNMRHITRKAMELLSHVVREPGEIEFRSKNVLPVTGRVTNELKRAWRLNDVWKELVAPRYMRMNKLTNSNLFGNEQTSKTGKKYFDCNLHDLIRENNESYDIKRIDHRHHAMDALIVALCTENHVNYINNINAKSKSEDYGKQRKIENYRKTLKRKIKFSILKPTKTNSKNKNWFYMLPGELRLEGAENSDKDSVMQMTYSFKDSISFKGDYKKIILFALRSVVTSPKNSKFPIRKTSNRYWSYKNEHGELNLMNGNNIKRLIKQIDSSNPIIPNKNKRNIAIRKNMHDDIPYGEKYYDYELKDLAKNIGLRKELIDTELKVKIEDLFYNCNEDIKELSKRIKEDKSLPKKSFFKIKKKVKRYTNRKSLVGLTLKQIDKIADPLLYKEIQTHIKKYNDIELALSADGVEQFNANRSVPVYKVTLIESGDGRYVLGENGIKPNQHKMVKGKNFCYVIDKAKSAYKTVSLKQLIDGYKKEGNVNDLINSTNKDEIYLFPGDLVCFGDCKNVDNLKSSNIYQFINSSGGTSNFAPVNIATVIWDYKFPNNTKGDKELNKQLLEVYDFKGEKEKPLKNELGLSSRQNKNTREIKYIDKYNTTKEDLIKAEQIKENCIKLNVDRLGNISIS